MRPHASPRWPIRLSVEIELHSYSVVKERDRSKRSHGADRDRTGDIQLAKLALSQLSYSPSLEKGRRLCIAGVAALGSEGAPFQPEPPRLASSRPLRYREGRFTARSPACSKVGLDRFELSTPRLSSVCSNQLSYRPNSLRPALPRRLFNFKDQLLGAATRSPSQI